MFYCFEKLTKLLHSVSITNFNFLKALDEDERAEWVTELEKCKDFSDSRNGIEVEDLEIEDMEDDYESSIYEEVGPMLIYDVPKNSLVSAPATVPAPARPGSASAAAEASHNSLTPPPPLPMRTLRVEQDTEADFPPPPAFEDTTMLTSTSKILVDPHAKQHTSSMLTTNSSHTGNTSGDFEDNF